MGRKGNGKDENETIEDIELKQKELQNSSLVAALNRNLKVHNFKEIRFLAVGNFGLENKNAEYQTALTLYFRDNYGITKITAWDPNFKKKDLRVLTDLGIMVKEADPKPANDILWFVPHAPYFLEPSLLRRVGNCVYIGNDLNLSGSNTMRDAKECEWYRSAANITPIIVKPKDAWREAFKNTAIHQLNDPVFVTDEQTIKNNAENPQSGD